MIKTLAILGGILASMAFGAWLMMRYIIAKLAG